MNITHPQLTGFATALALGTTIGVACKGHNDSHCYFNDGDKTCAERYGDERRFCVTNCYDTPGNDGCVAARPEPLDDSCYSPCGHEQTLADDPDPSCEGVAEGSGTSMGDGPTSN